MAGQRLLEIIDIYLMGKLEVYQLESPWKERVFQLWNSEYPVGVVYQNLPAFDEFLDGAGNKKHFMLTQDDILCGWCMTFDRDGERWFSLIVNPNRQKRGLGRYLMDWAMSSESSLCGWVSDHDKDRKSNGEKYLSPLEFYIKLGFSVHSDTRFEKKGLSAVKVSWQKERYEGSSF